MAAGVVICANVLHSSRCKCEECGSVSGTVFAIKNSLSLGHVSKKFEEFVTSGRVNSGCSQPLFTIRVH